jgi:hypothetical protein
MWKVYVPLMGRNIRALGHVTQITQIALIDHFPVILLVDPVDFHRRRFINEIKEGRKAVTQGYTTPAAMTQVKHAFKLRH